MQHRRRKTDNVLISYTTSLQLREAGKCGFLWYKNGLVDKWYMIITKLLGAYERFTSLLAFIMTSPLPVITVIRAIMSVALIMNFIYRIPYLTRQLHRLFKPLAQSGVFGLQSFNKAFIAFLKPIIKCQGLIVLFAIPVNNVIVAFIL